jgi:uncharacterized protein YifN (PemK superfamily)
MAITYRPKVGEVLECDFGQFKLMPNGDFDQRNFDGRIPPEMIKRRLVVVLNGKLGGSCLVVPISSTQNMGGVSQGLHVPLEPDLFKVTDFYDRRDRWAKSELIQPVSNKRLYKLMDNGKRFDHYLPREKVELVQRAVIKAVSAGALIK